MDANNNTPENNTPEKIGHLVTQFFLRNMKISCCKKSCDAQIYMTQPIDFI